MCRLVRGLVLAVIVLASLGCGGSHATPTATATATLTATPTATYTPQARAAIKEFTEQCASMQKNTPLSIIAHGTRNEVLTYFSNEWSKLVPPPSLVAYHAAVQTAYEEWRTLPKGVEFDLNSPSLRRLWDVTFELDSYTLDLLEASRCINRDVGP